VRYSEAVPCIERGLNKALVHRAGVAEHRRCRGQTNGAARGSGALTSDCVVGNSLIATGMAYGTHSFKASRSPEAHRPPCLHHVTGNKSVNLRA
jgi:hypothetical protein